MSSTSESTDSSPMYPTINGDPDPPVASLADSPPTSPTFSSNDSRPTPTSPQSSSDDSTPISPVAADVNNPESPTLIDSPEIYPTPDHPNDPPLPITIVTTESPISNTYECSLYVFDRSYLSAEHAYLHAKAKLCGDEDTEKLILAAESVSEARRLGDLLSSNETWDADRVDCMRVILDAKYAQCEEYREAILEAYETNFVVTSADTFWGGYPEGFNNLGQLHDLFQYVESKVLIIGSSHVRNFDKNLAEYHPDQEIDVVCMPGGRIQNVLDKLESTPLYPYSDIYVIIGSNDLFTKTGARQKSTDDVIEAMTFLQSTFGLSSDARTRICSILPRCGNKYWNCKTLKKFNANIRAINKAEVLDLVPVPDLYAKNKLDSEKSTDGVHLTAEAKDYVAREMFKW